jgi:hypothetical protein
MNPGLHCGFRQRSGRSRSEAEEKIVVADVGGKDFEGEK